LYGPKNDEPATTILSENNAMESLRLRLRQVLGNIGCNFVDLTYTSAKYKPHISNKPNRDVPYGTFKLSSLTIKQKNKESKEIVKVIKL